MFSNARTIMIKLMFAAFAAANLLFAGVAWRSKRAAPCSPPPPLVDWDKIQIKTTDLGNNTYLLEGQGGNITVAVGNRRHHHGGRPVSRRSPTRSRRRSGRSRRCRCKYLVNTHYHGDHTGGNENFAKDGVIIVAHDNIRARLAGGTKNGLTGALLRRARLRRLPKETYFGGSRVLEVGGRKAQLTHIANAHTDGDTWVYFADANVLATGDTLNNLKRYQNIDFANGGDVRGMIRAMDTLSEGRKRQHQGRSGHGPLATKADIVEFREMLVTSRDRIEKLVNEGKTEQEVIDLKPLADLDAKWASTPQQAAAHTRNVYNSFQRL